MKVSDMRCGDVALVDMRIIATDAPHYHWLLRTWKNVEDNRGGHLVSLGPNDCGTTWNLKDSKMLMEKEVIVKGRLNFPDVDIT